MNDIAGAKIAKLIKKHNMTQKELAKKLNVTPQAVSKWVNNKSVPDFPQIQAMSEMFGVLMDDFFYEKSKASKQYKVIIKRIEQFYLIPSAISVFSNGKDMGVVQNAGTITFEVEQKEIQIELRCMFRKFFIKGIIKGDEILINCKFSRMSGCIIATTNNASKFIGEQGFQSWFKRFDKIINILIALLSIYLIYIVVMYI